MKRLKQLLIITTITLVVGVGGLYLNRFSFRNSDSALGQITNRIWNLNRVAVTNSSDKYVEISWSCEGKKQVIYTSKEGVIAKIPNEYGPNGFTVSVDGKPEKIISYIKPNWWMTTDYMFYVGDSIYVTCSPKIFLFAD